MDSIEVEQRPAATDQLVAPPVPRPGLVPAVQPAACGCNGGSGGDAPPAAAERPSFVYALGRIEPRFPNMGLEREFLQATASVDTRGLTDRAAVYKVLTYREGDADKDKERNKDKASISPYRYLARQLCWVLTIESVETYILRVRDPVDLDLLIASIRPSPSKTDVDVVIGLRGPLAPPEFCAGLVAPIVLVDQVYSFDEDSLLSALVPPEGTSAKAFKDVAKDLFERVMQIADNAGNTDEHRALNYLAVRNREVYVLANNQFAKNFSLTGIEVLPSRLSGTRKLVNVVFIYTERGTGVVEKYRARVDVTEEFPFLDLQVGLFIDRFTI